jgi:hypothetical protein
MPNIFPKLSSTGRWIEICGNLRIMALPKDEIDEVLEQISRGNFGPAERTVRDFLHEASQLQPPNSIKI